MEKAIEYEIERQTDVLEGGGRVVQETRLYDSDKNVTRPMRSKEEANDYRYFPDPDLPPLCVRAAGYLDNAEKPYLREIEKRLADRGLADRFHYAGELDREAKVAFLKSLDLMSVPAVYRESKGLYVLEAWANAVPVVVPDHGAFPELIRDTGGGLLCRPDDPADLASKLKRLIQDPDRAAECGRRAQQAVHQRYNTQVMARRTIELYGEVGSR